MLYQTPEADLLAELFRIMKSAYYIDYYPLYVKTFYYTCDYPDTNLWDGSYNGIFCFTIGTNGFGPLAFSPVIAFLGTTVTLDPDINKI